MIREKAKANLCGKMEEFMMVRGKMESSMEKENSSQKKE
jgi:hypothetical protein